MITVDNDNQLLLQQSGWDAGDDVIINQYPTYTAKGNYFPEWFVTQSGRPSSTIEIPEQVMVVTDDGVTVIYTTWKTQQVLGPVPEAPVEPSNP